MKTTVSRLGLALAITLGMVAFGGCAAKNDAFSYSDGIDDNGFYEGITALEHVELGEYEGISIPREVYTVSDGSVQAEAEAIVAGIMAGTGDVQLTDEFVAENLAPLYGYSTVAELKEAIRSSIQSAAMFEHLKAYLLENMAVASIPDELIEYQEKTMVKYYQESADYYQMELEDFLRIYVRVSSVERLLEKNRGYNEDNARFALILQAIAEDAGFIVTDGDVAAYFKKYVETEDYEEYEKTYGLPYTRYITLQQYVMDFLVKNAILE